LFWEDFESATPQIVWHTTVNAGTDVD